MILDVLFDVVWWFCGVNLMCGGFCIFFGSGKATRTGFDFNIL